MFAEKPITTDLTEYAPDMGIFRKPFTPPSCLLRTTVWIGIVSIVAPRSSSDEIRFGRDVRPILAKHCFTCHGPDADARQADLRLDIESRSRADLGGYKAVDPGKVDESELIVRISSDDPDVRMPPAETHPPLSSQDIETLRDWVRSGGKYEKHWSFIPSKKIAPPKLESRSWCRTPIDQFVLKRMNDAKLSPSPAASRETMLRRVFMDLIGRPPTIEEADQFFNDRSALAYERLVDRLLTTPEYAERFARPWLDLARYSDTNGYEKDRNRTIWPYRDWVIQSLAADMPFDQFSIAQLAGDMLPDADVDSRVATGFHRNTMLNEEGGIDPLEYRFYAMVDRVATTGTVWLGLTTGCAQCHTHKYDPITHTDYYALMALLGNADEPEQSVETGSMKVKRVDLEKQISEREQQLISQIFENSSESNRKIIERYNSWRKQTLVESVNWSTPRPIELKSSKPKLDLTESGSILASGDATKRDVYTLTMPATGETPLTAIRLEVLPHESLPASGPGMAYYEGRRGDFFLSRFRVFSDGVMINLDRPSASYGKISVGSGSADAANVLDEDNSTGWSTSGQTGKANQLIVQFAKPFVSQKPWTIELLFERHFVAALGHFRIDVTTDMKSISAKQLSSDLESKIARGKASAAERDLRLHFLLTSKETKALRKPLERLRKSVPIAPRTLVMRERAVDNPRTTHRHHRGEYLQPKEPVDPAVPAVFRDGDQANTVTNRLEFAEWLVSEQNPLVGRVVVNRTWREFFGTGIVRTAGDFGTQSEPPSHPDLLDWLDHEFRSSGWSMKRLHRMIVLSATYRQRTGAPPSSDPDNRLLSRFTHRRYDAERIRDAMLSAAGLIDHRIGGASVYPPQPPTVQQLSYGKPKWPTSAGGDRYRRSLYTFSKRTAPFAAYTTFDGPSGELCVARRQRSTTPLQALTLLNDEMYVEIAREFAKDVLRNANANGEKTPEKIIQRMFQRLLVRDPDAIELERIKSFYESQSDHPEPWMLVARALLNTDEAITTP